MNHITTPVGVRGRVEWRVFDALGRPARVLTRNRDGRERLVLGGSQPNLITNTGMNAIAGSWQTGHGIWNVAAAQAVAANWRYHARFGTGSTAPAFTDTTLGNQVLASNTSGAFTGFQLAGSGTENVTWTCEYMRRKLATATSAVNLTEFGLSFSEADADLAVRELFRDEFGDPITLSLPAGASIRLDHTVEVTLDLSEVTGTLALEELDVNGGLVTTHNIDYAAKWFTRTSGASSDSVKTQHLTMALQAAGTTQVPTFASGNVLLRASGLNPALPGTFGGALDPSGWATIGNDGITNDSPAYVADSHEIARRFVIDPAIANGDWTGYGRRLNRTYFTDNQGGGLLIAFRNDGVHVKEDTHSLTWEHRLSWSRA